MQGYLKAVRTFDFESAFPNYAQNAYDWRVDKYEPQRSTSSLYIGHICCNVDLNCLNSHSMEFKILHQIQCTDSLFADKLLAIGDEPGPKHNLSL